MIRVIVPIGGEEVSILIKYFYCKTTNLSDWVNVLGDNWVIISEQLNMLRISMVNSSGNETRETTINFG